MTILKVGSGLDRVSFLWIPDQPHRCLSVQIASAPTICLNHDDSEELLELVAGDPDGRSLQLRCYVDGTDRLVALHTVRELYMVATSDRYRFPVAIARLQPPDVEQIREWSQL